MSYWEISPDESNDYDLCLMRGDTDEEHRAALEYAKARLEQLWDQADVGHPYSVTITLHAGPMPEFEEKEKP